MRAIFGRKIVNLTELKVLTLEAVRNRVPGLEYLVLRDVLLNNEDFEDFANDFLVDREWIFKTDGGKGADSKLRCIRVVNKETNEAVLVNSEGYQYARYTALEINDL